jgi:hypothetical protein
MLNNNYNYKLNGIEHEIILNNNLKIDQKPLNEKILVSNKYMLKYINDLFDYYSIEFCLLNNTLLGLYIFNGINIFNSTLEIGITENNIHKIKKIENDIKYNDFNILFNDNYIKISSIFLDKIKTTIYIYLLKSNNESDLIEYKNIDNNIINYEFYDIFPIKKQKFEEFEISSPNKIEKVLIAHNFNLNYIIFTTKNIQNNSNKKKIIDEVEPEKSFINSFISVIKPFFIKE